MHFETFFKLHKKFSTSNKEFKGAQHLLLQQLFIFLE
mgnify:CR=1 FL=1